MGVKRGDENESVGAAERAARFRQYEYKANASLVLQADKTERRAHEPSEMPESLWGKIDAKAFGDRARHRDDDGRKKKTTTGKKRRRKIVERKEEKKNHLKAMDAETGDDALEAMGGPFGKKRKRGPGMKKKDVLSAEMNFNVGYKPKTRETKAAYEVYPKSMTEQFGEQPSDVLRGRRRSAGNFEGRL